jgi:hypothetical protein
MFIVVYYRTINVTRIKTGKHVAQMGRGDVHRAICSANLRESGHLENLGLDGKIILKWILKVIGWGLQRN